MNPEKIPARRKAVSKCNAEYHAAVAEELDQLETKDLLDALARRFMTVVMIWHRPPSPDDGEDALGTYVASYNPDPQRRLLNAIHMTALAQQRFVETLSADGDVDFSAAEP